MNVVDLLLLILVQVSSALKAHLTGGAAASAETADSVLGIIQAGVAAYEKVVGEPLDPSLVKPLEPLP